MVNAKGYLINEQSGAIRSRFTYEDIFPGEYHQEDLGEIPMPFRLERYNFNPHKILGSFDYDAKTGKPYFLKNKFGILTDKNYKPVNKMGFLINEEENVIDNEGHVKFLQSMLTPKENLPYLYTYSGETFKI